MEEEYIYSYEELLDLVIKYQKENKELSRICELYSKSLYNADLKKAEARIDKAIDSYINRNKYKKKRFLNGLNVADLMYIILKGENK